MRDFTFPVYGELLDAGRNAGFEFLTVREYLTRDDLPERFLILRHDVDRKPENSVTAARMEAERNIAATYYFRTIQKTFRTRIIKQIAGAGHEVGYHYEDVDRADGDVDAAHERFADNLAQLRRLCDVDTACMHGNPLTRHDNRDMWDGDRSPADYGLLGEAYLSMDFEDVTYFSDTGGTWRDGALKVKDHTMGEGEKTVQADSTWDLIELLEDGDVERACLLTHPNRWADGYREYVAERAKDSAVNLVKYGLHVMP